MVTRRGTNEVDTLTGTARNDRLFGLAGNDVLLALQGNDVLSGGRGNDRLDGQGGNDTLDGGAGQDALRGGEGNDLYIVNDRRDSTLETANNGTDTVRASISWTLSSDTEILELTGRRALNGTGNAQNNTITGNIARNTLAGQDGDDTLVGGLGQDVLRGGNGNDILIGDVDVRGGRTDTSNNDTMEGGAGNDTYYVNSAADGVVEAVGQGTDNVILTGAFASTAYTLADNVENLSVLGTNAVSLTGNALANTITGNAANNSLVGGAGNDTLTGGAGADQFAYITLRAFSTSDVGQDTITDFVQGTDRITLSRQTFGLSSTVGNGLSVASEFASVNDAASAEISAALVVFNRANNSLIYNQNGAAAGFGTGSAFATTTNVATIASSDFTIVV